MTTAITTLPGSQVGTDQKTLYIEVGQVEAFKKQLAKLNEASGMEGIPAIEILEESTLALPAAPGEMAMLVAVFMLDYPVVELGDWAVVGRLEAPAKSTANKLFAFAYSKVEADIVALLAKTDHPIECEHCQVNRRRVESYLLKNCTTGEYKQVGSSCLGAFTGAIGSAAISLAGLSKFVAKWNGKLLNDRRGAKLFAIDVRQYLADVLFMLGAYGYHLLRDCSSEKNATHYKALNVPAFIAAHEEYAPNLGADYTADLPYNLALADEIRAHYASKATTPDTFEHNVNVIMREDSISLFRTRPLNILTAAVGSLRYKKLHAISNASEHVGKRGQLISDALTIVHVDRKYSGRFDIYLKNSSGNVLVAEADSGEIYDKALAVSCADIGQVLTMEYRIVGHRKGGITSIETNEQKLSKAAAILADLAAADAEDAEMELAE